MQPSPEVVAALVGASPEQLNAVLEVMFFVASADGRVEADELRGFLRVAKATGASPSAVSASITQWRSRGSVDVAERVAQLSDVLGTDELRRTAFQLATRTAASDGHLDGAEAQVLELVGDALGVGG
ncbi:MAG TPA: tellurite resistance TerB family protein [Polyangiaceae bacterium]|nr:tellurite resistance TerB family protein [Polyangiaceae bacterium]